MAIRIKTAKGDIKISNTVIMKIIAVISSSCYGVVGISSGGKGKILNPDNISSLARGVKIKVENSKINIDLHIVTAYGVNIHTVSESIRHNVKYQIEHFTGVAVNKVNVHVETLTILD